MKGKINNGKQLGMWTTFDRTSPGTKILWGDVSDLLLYDSNVSVEGIEKDIEIYYGSSLVKLGWSLRALTPDEVYSTYLLG
jgi:hypothetical protein